MLVGHAQCRRQRVPAGWAPGAARAAGVGPRVGAGPGPPVTHPPPRLPLGPPRPDILTAGPLSGQSLLGAHLWSGLAWDTRGLEGRPDTQPRPRPGKAGPPRPGRPHAPRGLQAHESPHPPAWRCGVLGVRRLRAPRSARGRRRPRRATCTTHSLPADGPPPDGPQTTGGRAPAPAPHLPTLLPASWRPAHSGLPGEAQSERRRQQGRGRGRGSVGTAATVRLSPAGARGLSGDGASLVLPLPATRGPREADARRAAPRPAGRPPRPQQEGRLRTNRGRTAGHASARGRGPRALSPKSKIVGPGSTRTCTEAPLPATGARVGDPRAPRPAARAEARVARLRVHLGEDIAGGSTP